MRALASVVGQGRDRRSEEVGSSGDGAKVRKGSAGKGRQRGAKEASCDEGFSF